MHVYNMPSSYHLLLLLDLSLSLSLYFCLSPASLFASSCCPATTGCGSIIHTFTLSLSDFHHQHHCHHCYHHCPDHCPHCYHYHLHHFLIQCIQHIPNSKSVSTSVSGSVSSLNMIANALLRFILDAIFTLLVRVRQLLACKGRPAFTW